jgi:hypothetical protein
MAKEIQAAIEVVEGKAAKQTIKDRVIANLKDKLTTLRAAFPGETPAEELAKQERVPEGTASEKTTRPEPDLDQAEGNARYGGGDEDHTDLTADLQSTHQTTRPKPDSVSTNNLGMKFAFVPHGSFLMGGGGGRPWRNASLGVRLVQVPSRR